MGKQLKKSGASKHRAPHRLLTEAELVIIKSFHTDIPPAFWEAIYARLERQHSRPNGFMHELMSLEGDL